MNELSISDDTVFAFDARGVAKRFRHAAIFGALESLFDGETMRFVNDHDPLPLLDQIRQRYGAQIAMNYVTRDNGHIVIDFSVQLGRQEPVAAASGAAAASQTQGGGCGGGGGGCGCASR